MVAVKSSLKGQNGFGDPQKSCQLLVFDLSENFLEKPHSWGLSLVYLTQSLLSHWGERCPQGTVKDIQQQLFNITVV